MILDLAFILLVVGLATILLRWVFLAGTRRGWDRTRSRKRVVKCAIFICAWLVLTAVLALRGFSPIFVILPALIGVVALGLSPKIREDLEAIPGRWVILLQTFRVPMELILWFLYLSHLAPKEMTFEGRNIDLIIGLSAPFISYLFFTKQLLSRKSTLIWNGLGILILTNVVAYGVLSVNPPVAFIAVFPFVWLPTFVVPVAYLLHIVSIRQVLRSPCWRDA